MRFDAPGYQVAAARARSRSKQVAADGRLVGNRASCARPRAWNPCKVKLLAAGVKRIGAMLERAIGNSPRVPTAGHGGRAWDTKGRLRTLSGRRWQRRPPAALEMPADSPKKLLGKASRGAGARRAALIAR